MTLESNRTMGGIGALLMVIGTLPWAGPLTGIIGLVGLILTLIAMKGLADHYSDSSIFNNVLYGVITAVVGGIIAIAIIINAAIGLLTSLGINLSSWYDWRVLQDIDWKSMIDLNAVWPYVTTIFLSLVLLFVFFIVAAFFFRRSLSNISTKTRVGLFGTTGTLILVGALLTIVVIGFLILWVSLILLTVAFFSIPTQTTQPAATPSEQATQ